MDLCLTITHLYAKPVLPEELSKSEQWLPWVTVRDKFDRRAFAARALARNGCDLAGLAL